MLGTREHPQAPGAQLDEPPSRASYPEWQSERVASSLARVSSLDGLRGLAVAAVVVYHLSPSLLPGGFLGVSIFFVLSGYLITSLLLREAHAHARIDLRRFWERRFRRLLPAALAGLALGVAVAWVAGDSHQLRTLPGDVASAVAYVANWRFIAQGTQYGSHYLQASVVQHYWSLAIEEQFYIVMALVAALLARVARRRGTWALVLGGLAMASMWTTTALGRADQTGIYFATTTRSFELLAGALLAVAVDGRVATITRPRRWRRLQLVGLLAAAGLVAALLTTPIEAPVLYRGGLWVAAGLAVAVLVAARVPGPIATALSWKPLTALGVVSYGVYVYHWPLFIWLSPESTHLDGLALATVRVGATLAVAGASYRLIEQPVRLRTWRLPRLGGLVLAGCAGIVVVITAVTAGTAAQARAVRSAPSVLLPASTASAGAASAGSGAGLGGTSGAGLPRDVLFLGDSMLHDAFPAIQAGLSSRGIRSSAIGGAGQSLMSDGGRWLGELTAAVAASRPDVVVLESCCGTQTPWVADDGRTYQPSSPEYWAEWSRLVDAASARAAAGGARVLWVLPPPADGDRSRWYGAIRQRMAEVSRLERQAVAAQPTMGVIDWGVLSAPDGSYAAALPDRSGRMVTIRAGDGVHFSPTGQALQARVTVEQIISEWSRLGGPRGGPVPATGP